MIVVASRAAAAASLYTAASRHMITSTVTNRLTGGRSDSDCDLEVMEVTSVGGGGAGAGRISLPTLTTHCCLVTTPGYFSLFTSAAA